MRVIIDSKERRAFAADLVRHITADPLMEVIIQPHIDEKTNEQRSYFHVKVRELAKQTGYTEGEVKELVKKELLGTKIITIGKMSKEVTCSSELDDEGKPRDKLSYSELIEGIDRIAAENGFILE